MLLLDSNSQLSYSNTAKLPRSGKLTWKELRSKLLDILGKRILKGSMEVDLCRLMKEREPLLAYLRSTTLLIILSTLQKVKVVLLSLARFFVIMLLLEFIILSTSRSKSIVEFSSQIDCYLKSTTGFGKCRLLFS